jgi:hypothetical protein
MADAAKIIMTEGDAPVTPAAGTRVFYAKSTGFYSKDDEGNETGMVGVNGIDGKSWYSGDGAPGDGTGVDGDFYIDTTNKAFYGPKAAGTWVGTGPVSMVGLINPMTTAGDTIYGGADGVPTRLAKGTASQVLTMNSGATAPEWGTVASGLPLGYLSGLTIAHAADTEHDITVAAGEARDATDAADMVLASAITKQFDAEWAVGDAAGGFAAGESLPASGTIHIWLIKRADTGVVDVFANDHATSGLTPTLPTDYDYKRRIFSLRTDSSNNIINGDQWGTGLNRTFMYDTPQDDISDGASGTGGKTAAISVPAGIVVKAIVTSDAGTNALTYLSWISNTDIAAASPFANATALGGKSLQCLVFTNTSSQIRYRVSTSTTFDLATQGWEDSL